MKIFVLSNLYLPYYIGGYELRCKEVVDGLRRRGYSVFVLTSTYGLKGGPKKTDNIFRQLLIYRYKQTQNISSSKVKLFYTEWQNNRRLRKVVQDLVPDIIFIWNLQGLSMSLLVTAQRAGIPLVYSLGDTWLIDAPKGDEWFNLWNYIPKNPIKRVIKRFLQNCGLRGVIDHYVPTSEKELSFPNLFFNNEDLKQRYLEASLKVENAPVIYRGVDTGEFVFRQKRAQALNKLLFCGRVIHDKGVHLAIEAVGYLVSNGYTNLLFDIVGNGGSVEYKQYLKNLIVERKIELHVNFLGKLPQERMPEVYNFHDIFLFTSIWREPFAFTILEAMASGCVVIGAEVGGSKEILKNGVNCLTFEPGNAIDLAEKIEKLILSPQLWSKLSKGGRRTVVENFNIETMTDKIEAYLSKIIADRSRC